MVETVESLTASQSRRHRMTGRSLLALVIVFGGGIFIGRYVLTGAVATPAALQFVAVDDGERRLIFPTFWEAWDTLHEKYLDSIDDSDLFYGAVRGLVRAVGDPYTVFADPTSTKQFEETINGSFSGIGIEIGIRNNAPTVIAPLKGSPADVAGVVTADLIAAINGEPITPDMTLDDIVQQIRGPRGTTVMLTVLHKGAEATSDITITRDTIEIESVKVVYLDDLAHLTLSSFNGDTAQRFTTAAREIAQRGVSGLIIDLRNNPGGFLQAAVDIASRVLPSGTLIVTEKGTVSKEYESRGNPILGDIPIVVLVNEGSASASEILAGALQEQATVLIIGTTTFGKGSVQEFVKLEDGSSLRVTVARWYTPKGRNLDEDGIEPTIVVEDDRTTDVDEPLERAKEELKKISAAKS